MSKGAIKVKWQECFLSIKDDAQKIKPVPSLAKKSSDIEITSERSKIEASTRSEKKGFGDGSMFDFFMDEEIFFKNELMHQKVIEALFAELKHHIGCNSK